MDSPWDAMGRAWLRERAASVLSIDRPDVFSLALKPASRGDGLIARLYTLAGVGAPVQVALRDRRIEGAAGNGQRHEQRQPAVRA